MYNGEVYNYRELARRYGVAQRDIDEVGDGLVIANAVARDGPAALKQFDGMYALVWHDAKAKEVFAARDLFGIKPLYMACTSDRVVLSSELKGIVGADWINEVSEIGPGTTWRMRWHQSRGWESRECATCTPIVSDPHKRIDPVELGDCIKAAVRQCVDCDKRIGVYLSGGVDSAAVFAIAASMRPDVVPLVLGGPRAIDAPHAIELARRLGKKPCFKEVPSEAELFEHVSRTVDIVESFEPNVVRQSSVQYFISRLALDAGTKVILCGEGADELFCGYPEFRADGGDWLTLRREFVSGLHRTQLQRVDRMSMYWTTEVRVPYLMRGIAEIALGSGDKASFVARRGPQTIVKHCLREATRPWLEDPWRSRKKVVLSEGVGLGGNDPRKGMFAALAEQLVDRRRLRRVQDEFPDWHIETPEEALYFELFHAKGYTKCTALRQRPRVNRVHSVGPRR